ncbi:class I SAM-dependent methyltransferase [Methylocystis bryophila]|uniref:class I SAM-dependent methyltransferase n=1 Tax=Methylocystis bryophila TaxID=655015 RepID=UPI001FD998AE|nr:class I SAM-dependent methyltransferase [Methylocystis bryophila]BDV36808.1 methyltransferase type 11 [Methylocystis bryophila]
MSENAFRRYGRLAWPLLLCFCCAARVAAQTAAPPPTSDMPPSHAMHHHGEDDDGAFHHRFEGAENWAKEFDKAERDEWQKPQAVLEALRIGKGAIVADIGAGTGYFATRIARLAPQGRVYAVDVEPGMARYLGERAKREGLTNLIPVLAQGDSAPLPEPVDLALVVDTFHHIGHRVAYFARLKSSLKDDGRLAIVDFKTDSPSGPPPQFRIPPEQAIEELMAAGYTLVETGPSLPRQYMLIFRKSAP